MIEYILNNKLVIFCCLIIAAVFAFFLAQLYKVFKANKALKVIAEKEDILDGLEGSMFKPLKDAYAKTFTVFNGSNTNIPASEVFNFENISTCYRFNPMMINIASGTLVGLGLFGTFLGLTVGIGNFKSDTSDEIQKSIQGLLDGMATAFMTSLFGMSFSILFSILDKACMKSINRTLLKLTEALDEKYYIDDVAIIDNKINALMGLNDKLLNDAVKSLNEKIDSQMTFSDDEGNTIRVANSIREIQEQNTKQTAALKNFSSELAMGLNDMIGNTIDERVIQKIVPLMDNIENTTKEVVQHIDTLAANMSSPATDMIETVVNQLETSMSKMIDEFKSNLSGSATNQLEQLAANLGDATKTMAEFPKNMETISNTLLVTIDEVKNAISEITNSSANSNSTAMKQMQEQITFATTSISNAIAKVDEVMSSLTKSSEESTNEAINKLSDASNKMSDFLAATVASLSSSVQESVKSITDDVNNRQADLIALQEDTTSQTKKLLEAFNVGLERLEKMNEYISGTMNQFGVAQGQITGTTAHLQTITGDMKIATEVFHKSQSEYAESVSSVNSNTQKAIEEISGLLVRTNESSENYVNQFETIKSGLTIIFNELKNGLVRYSETVQENTQKFLDNYTSSLTQTTDALANTINQQNEVVELLNDTLSKVRK